MNFYIQEPKTVEQFLARLTDVEQVQIRMAQTPERLEHMRQNQFAYDMIDYRTIVEAHTRLCDAFDAHPKTGRNGGF